MDTLWQDLRYGLRMLLKNRAYTLIAIITLALGIGANSVIFSVVNAVLLRPLPYQESDRLVMFNLSVPDYQDLTESNQVFDQTAIFASNLYNVIDSERSEQVTGAVVSPEFFTLLSRPLLGRGLTKEDAHSDLVVIGYQLWQKRFAGDANVLGQTINLGGTVHTIVGVMPKEFQFPNANFQLWVSFDAALARVPAQLTNRSLRIFRALAHLKPGVTLTQANADLNTISTRLQQQYPNTNNGFFMTPIPIYQQLVGDVRPALLILLATVGLVLLIACANVANLLLARTTAREREILIRSALGAGQWRIARQLLTESVLLATIGGVLGLLLAAWSIELLPALGGYNIPRINTIRIDLTVLLFTLGASMFTGILFGLAPAWQATRTNLSESLKQGGRESAGSTQSHLFRNALVIAEVALSVIVLIGAGLLIKSFNQLLQVDTGFNAENLLTAQCEMSRFKDPLKRTQLVEQIIAQIGQIQGVQSVGGATGLPPVTPQRVSKFEIPGVVLDPKDDAAYFMATTPEYFRTIGSRLAQGRYFNERDTKDAGKVVIVNEYLAQKLFPNQDPVGKQLKLLNPEYEQEWRTIVGVVGNIKYTGLDGRADYTIYTPFSQTPFIWSYLMVRTTVPPMQVATEIQKAVSQVNEGLIAAKIQPMDQLISDSVAQPRFNLILLTSFASLALLLSSVGIYGVVSYTVVQRTREIGIRIALGAKPADIFRLIVRQSMLPAIIGVVIGLIAALALTRLMTSLLFGVGANDPATFIIITGLLIGVALLACLLPARKAMRVDPMVALRYE